jgi:hypothetical protein
MSLWKWWTQEERGERTKEKSRKSKKKMLSNQNVYWNVREEWVEWTSMRKSLKGYRSIFFSMMDFAVFNMLIMHSKLMKEKLRKK